MKRDKPAAKSEAKPPQQREREAGPLSSHPVGTAVGGVAGAAAAGAAAGSMAGPPGAFIGAAIGAVAGAMAGKLAAGAVDPEREDAFWRRNWSDRDYVEPGTTYDQDWGPAYRYGVESFMRSPGRHFNEMESELSQHWPGFRGDSRLDWSSARFASLDAWQRARDLAERSPPEGEGSDQD